MRNVPDAGTPGNDQPIGSVAPPHHRRDARRSGDSRISRKDDRGDNGSMTWTMIRLDLARTEDLPQGSAAHSYLLRLPLDEHGIVDPDSLRAAPERATVLRSWPDEPDVHGYLRHGRKGWVLSYAPGDEDDEPIFHLETHPLRLGEYVTITERDGSALCFRVSLCDQLTDA
jgi:hypothetical protein